MADGNDKLKKIGALWKGTGHSGAKFLSGVVQDGAGNDIRVVIFPNGFKEEEKHPDFVVYLSRPREQAEPPKPAAKPAKGAKKPVDEPFS